MTKPRILLQLDADPQPSVFDAVVAVDAGVECLLRHGGVRPQDVRALVHGTLFTRGLEDLRRTAIFVGGSQVLAGEALLAEVLQAFFGPFRVSVMMDANGANTTAAAAVLAAARHVPLSGAEALVLGGTGPVGQRVVRLLAREGAAVRVASRSIERARETCEAVEGHVPEARVSPLAVKGPEESAKALAGAAIVIAAGAAGVELLSADARRAATALRVASIEATDRARERDGATCYGALGVGGAKMKIHKAALRRLFRSNDQVFDAEQVYELGRELEG
jgi:hypothetical protein